MFNLLYIVNFYGTPPLDYLERYIRETKNFNLFILKLPSVRPGKGRLKFNSFLKYPDGSTIDLDFDLWFPFPAFAAFIFQYVVNFFTIIYFLIRCDTKKFDISIGETSFGGALSAVLKHLGISGYGIYMNGDVLPEFKKRTSPFYFPESGSLFIKLIDWSFIVFQYSLRKLGFTNDLLWYPNESIPQWDKDHQFFPKDSILIPNIMVDFSAVKENINFVRNKPILGYIGRLDDSAGVSFSLEMLHHLIKIIPDVKVLYVGGTDRTVEKYSLLAKKLGVEKHVKFYGFVESMEDAFEFIMPAKLGLALYLPSHDNISMYSEPSKPKEYIKLGIPVVMIENGPLVSVQVSKSNAGFLVGNHPESAAKKISEILMNDKLVEALKAGVISYASTLDYKEQFKFFSDTILGKYANHRRS